MGSKEKIYLDQEGVNELQAEIEDIKRKIQENNAGRKQAFDAGAGDGWDSPEYEEIQRQENLLFAQLKRQSDLLANAVIIEKEENSDLIDVGDIVDVNLVYGPNDEEEFTFRLVGSSGGKKDDYFDVSINSPLGKVVYKKKVGDLGSYTVDNNVIKVIIKNKKIFKKSIYT